jgi:hypothetical protein
MRDNRIHGSRLLCGSHLAVLRAVTDDYLRRSGLDIKPDHGVIPHGTACVSVRAWSSGRQDATQLPAELLVLSRVKQRESRQAACARVSPLCVYIGERI